MLNAFTALKNTSQSNVQGWLHSVFNLYPILVRDCVASIVPFQLETSTLHNNICIQHRKQKSETETGWRLWMARTFFLHWNCAKCTTLDRAAREGAKFFNFCSDSMSRSMARKGAVIDSEQLVWRLTKRDLFSVSCRQWRRRLRLESRNRFTIGSPLSATSKAPLKIDFCKNS